MTESILFLLQTFSVAFNYVYTNVFKINIIINVHIGLVDFDNL